MSKVVPKQAGARPRNAVHATLPTTGSAIDLSETAEPSTGVPRPPRRQRSEDVEQMFLDLTRRAPTPAVGPSHWWG